MTEFDIAIIGGGPGGYVAAIPAAQQGAGVCLIEQERVGGTCLNHGCIPTKALYATALLRRRLADAASHGLDCGAVRFDYGIAAGRKDAVVEKLVGGVEQLLKANKVDVFRGSAAIEGAGRLRVRSTGDGRPHPCQADHRGQRLPPGPPQNPRNRREKYFDQPGNSCY